VPKKVVKHYSTHWKEANRLAHLTWASQPNGERSGIRLKGISCRSPLKYTGLRRGDVVVSVNGMPVDTERSLLKIYGRLMFWKKMEVVVKRGAKTITLQYDIV
jgi:S1-C subfamily serine protease